MSLLRSALESWHFASIYGFEFGARSRDFGFEPKNREEIHHWFGLFIDYSVKLAISDQSVAVKAKELLAETFRGLWIKAGMFDELEAAVKQIFDKGTWREGWLAVRTTIRFDSKEMDPELSSRLHALADLIKPTTLIERARLYALSNRCILDLADAIEDENEDKKASDRYLSVVDTARSIGREVASDEDVFKELLPDILSNDGAMLYIFGQGLADGCSAPLKMWQDFHKQLSLLDQSKRNYRVIEGFLSAISLANQEFSEKILNEAVTDSILAYSYPILQANVEINSEGIVLLCQLTPSLLNCT